MRHARGWLVVVAMLTAGCAGASARQAGPGSGSSSPAATGSAIRTASPSAAAGTRPVPLAECGPAPVSTGPSRGLISASLTGPATAASGSRLTLEVHLHSVDGAEHVLQSGASELVVLRDGRVVGEYEGGEPAYGLQATVGSTDPAPWKVSGLLSGCPEHPVDYGWPDLTRKPMPAGSYDVVAVLPDVSGKSSGNLVSAPLRVDVTADPSPLPSCGGVPVSTEPPQSRIAGRLTGPATAEAGSTVKVQVMMRSNLGRAEKFVTSPTVDVLVIRDGSVVGRAVIAHPAAEVEVTVPAEGELPLFDATAFTLSGCPEAPDGASPTRAPLPPGTYELAAEIADGDGVLVTEPLSVQVT